MSWDFDSFAMLKWILHFSKNKQTNKHMWPKNILCVWKSVIHSRLITEFRTNLSMNSALASEPVPYRSPQMLDYLLDHGIVLYTNSVVIRCRALKPSGGLFFYRLEADGSMDSKWSACRRSFYGGSEKRLAFLFPRGSPSGAPPYTTSVNWEKQMGFCEVLLALFFEKQIVI